MSPFRGQRAGRRLSVFPLREILMPVQPLALVASAAYAAPRIGVATMLTLGVASQLVAAIAIDHLGALGVAQRAVSTGRVVGVLLVIAGAVLVRRG